ncbi:mitochondrial thiamine pyrophosphate carrier-like isoform X2 [Maniola jurtina]|uniref:mitochondrial thiamine pyrophosphate carrier-like isoform X2 n=1 Tax=Maniola jurtina TaxID=191418 RepID=UPI001E686FF0|nr:mitochondrial thiamine pyrophosphate carrier-like isoform X2 [Maniola jurtina]
MISSKHPKMVGYSQEDSLSHSQKLIAGSVSGLVTRFVIQPLDVLKLRTQLQKKMPEGKSLNLHSMTKKILTEEGITAFWQGHVLGQAHSILSSTSQFFVYEMTTKLISSYPVDPKYKSVLEFMCGITAGFCCATLTIPLEVIRVRQALVKQQYGGLLNGAKAVYASGGVMAFFEGWTASVLMSHKPLERFQAPTTSRNLIKCTELIKCLTDTVKIEGFFGLYRGLLVTVYKAQATNVVLFTTYEFVCFLLRK